MSKIDVKPIYFNSSLVKDIVEIEGLKSNNLLKFKYFEMVLGIINNPLA